MSSKIQELYKNPPRWLLDLSDILIKMMCSMAVLGILSSLLTLQIAYREGRDLSKANNDPKIVVDEKINCPCYEAIFYSYPALLIIGMSLFIDEVMVDLVMKQQQKQVKPWLVENAIFLMIVFAIIIAINFGGFLADYIDYQVYFQLHYLYSIYSYIWFYIFMCYRHL